MLGLAGRSAPSLQPQWRERSSRADSGYRLAIALACLDALTAPLAASVSPGASRAAGRSTPSRAGHAFIAQVPLARKRTARYIFEKSSMPCPGFMRTHTSATRPPLTTTIAAITNVVCMPVVRAA